MRKMKKLNFIILAVVGAVLVYGCEDASTVVTEPEKTAAEYQTKQDAVARSENVDEEALKILRKATDYLTSLERFRLKAATVMDVVQESGQKLQFGSTVEVTVKRPNRLFTSRILDDGNVRRFWYDGTTATMYDEKEKAYGKIPVPDNIDEMLNYLEEVIKNPRPLADLLYNDLSHLADLPVSGAYVGESYLEDMACDHLAFRGESLDWQVWVDRGEKPLIRKVVITYKELTGGPQFIAHLEQWDIQPEITDSLFQFSPPEGAQRIRVVVLQPEEEKEGGAQ
jgi:hypothetical protein